MQNRPVEKKKSTALHKFASFSGIIGILKVAKIENKNAQTYQAHKVIAQINNLALFFDNI